MEIIYKDKEGKWFIGDKQLDETEMIEMRNLARDLDGNKFFHLVLNQFELAAKEYMAVKAESWEQALPFRGGVMLARHFRSRLQEFLK